MEPVPVAEKLLKTKLFGFSLQRLLQSFALPIAPGVILTVLNFPAIIFAPVVVLGVIIGAAVYIRTPQGQSPAAFLIGIVEYIVGPDRYEWQPVQKQDNEIVIQDGNESYTKERPQENIESESMVGDENTVENVDFEAIHDDGVIETEESYGLIVEIGATQWLILDAQSRETVYHSYSQFLMGIKSPIQTFTLPVPYKVDEYLDNIEDTNRHKPENESKLLEYGRSQHRNWLQNVISMGNIRDRRHFLVVTAKKHKQNEQESDGGFLSRIKPTRENVDQKKRYDELWSRGESVTNALPRTGVDTEIIDNRMEVIEILYYYYKGQESPISEEHGWITESPKVEDEVMEVGDELIN